MTVARRISLRALPPLMRFDDVLVQRHAGRTNPGVLWPEFERQYHARHLHGGLPICTRPEPPAGPVETVDEPCAFVAAHDGHFGHFVAEAAPRLPQTLAEAPDLPLVFSARMALDASTAAPTFLAVLDWHGIPRDRLRLVHRPTHFRKLVIAAQGEHLEGPPPPAPYLDAVEGVAARHDLPTRPQGAVYVSRARLPAKLGGHAGEDYLESCLTDLGVRVIHPESLPLPDQMRAYAGAAFLIFAEGSAVHGRQLLGRIDQDIAILVRRPEARIAVSALLPRCRTLDHAPVTRDDLHFLAPGGRRWPHSTVALYDVPALLDWFDGVGLPLRRLWRTDAYARARDARVLDWLTAIHAPRVEPWLRPANPGAYVLAQLEAYGLDHLRRQAAAIIAGGA